MKYRALRVIVLPLGLHPGPGATNMRLSPGDTFDTDASRDAAHRRFVRNRLKLGDLELVTDDDDMPAKAKGL